MALPRESVSGAIQPTNLSAHNILMRITRYFTKWKGKFKWDHRFDRFEIRLIRVRVASEEGGADWCAVEAEVGGDNFSGFETGLESASFYFLNDWIEYQ